MIGENQMKKRVGLIGDNSIAYIKKLRDILANNCIAVLIDWRIPLKTAIDMMCSYDIREFYIDENIDVDTIVPNGINMIKYINTENKITELPKSLYEDFKEILNSYSKDDAVIFFSSGTTGKAIKKWDLIHPKHWLPLAMPPMPKWMIFAQR